MTPKSKNCIFYTYAEAAIAAGFRPCLRCRPESAPLSPAWSGVTTTVKRAVKLIDAGALIDGSVQSLSARLGVSARHLNRLFNQYVGASPSQYAQTQRILLAKKLITETTKPFTEVAYAAGFGSVRRFNDAITKLYGVRPSDLRKRKNIAFGSAIELQLQYRPPYDWPQVCRFLQARAIPGVEEVEGDVYRRTVRFGQGVGVLEVSPCLEKHRMLIKFDFSDTNNLLLAIKQTRQMLDLDAQREKIHQALCNDPIMSSLTHFREGLGVPGAWDLFELTVRAVLGQQISVKAATTLSGRIAETFGEPLENSSKGRLLYIFPTSERLADAKLDNIGLTKRRAGYLKQIAAIFADNKVGLEAATDLNDIEKILCHLPGVGPWTAQYIAMRALKEPDAFPVADLGLIRGIEAIECEPCSKSHLQSLAENWRPFRAYAAMHLWTGES